MSLQEELGPNMERLSWIVSKLYILDPQPSAEEAAIYIGERVDFPYGCRVIVELNSGLYTISMENNR